MDDRRQLFRATAVVDAAGVCAAPGVLLMAGSRVVAAGTPQAVGNADDAVTHELAGVLIPSLVNAHAHLDLTNLGPQAHKGTFVDWIRGIRTARMGRGDDEIVAAVCLGVQLARRGGTALVGDIAGSLAAVHALRGAGLPGVSYLETFGLGKRQDAAIDRLGDAVDKLPAFANGVALGIEPHAPYSCGPRVYKAAAALGLPLATHLAESREEIDFTTKGVGPLAEFIRELGLWDDTIAVPGVHSIDAVLGAVDNLSILAVHLNDVRAEHLQLLHDRCVHVVYCPRASAYFGHAGHQYREMLAADVNVALGTDSIVCLDTPERLSVFHEMRLLQQRDGTDARTLLRMATTNGARALGFDESLFTFAPGTIAGVLALELDDVRQRHGGAAEMLAGAIASSQSPKWIVEPPASEHFHRA